MSGEELAKQAADKVREALADADRRAQEILAEAERRAEEIVADAERRAAEIRGRADDDASEVAAAIKEAAGALTAEVPEFTGEPRQESEAEPEPEPAPEPEPEPQPAAKPEEPQRLPPPIADEQGARLVAMKMALDGATHEQIVAWLDDEIPSGTREQIAADVLARAKP